VAIVGIDLGTTMSVVARVDEFGKPVVLKNADGELITPSVVYFESADSKVVGEEAVKEIGFHPELVVETVKHHMGVDTEYEFHGKTYRPEMVSALILKRLVQDAALEAGEAVDKVVITVPAIFGDGERAATRAAAEIAGLEVLAIIEEPVAAAIAYGFGNEARLEKNSTVLVFDLGGGTFDVTVMRIEGGSFRMLATDGDRRLGGKDWDKEVVDLMGTAFQREHEEDPRKNPITRQEMMHAAEEAKKGLTRKETVNYKVQHNGLETRGTISRDEFERISKPLLDQTEETTRKVIQKLTENGDLADGWRSIDHVLLAGGSSRMPQVAAMLRRVANKEPELLDVDLVVAQGAALYSLIRVVSIAEQTGDRTEVEKLRLPSGFERTLRGAEIKRVCSFALGIEAFGEGEKLQNTVIVPFNSELPCITSQVFGTHYDDQRQVVMPVLEGEHSDPARCKRLGEGVMTIPAGLPKGTPIEIVMGLDDESFITVSAREMVKGTTLDFVVERENAISAGAIEESKQRLALTTVS